MHQCLLSHVCLFATPWTVAHQALLSMGFLKQEYCSGLPFPPPGDLPDPEVKPAPPVSPALVGGFFLFLIERELLCDIVLYSAIHQHESAIGIHMSTPS